MIAGSPLGHLKSFLSQKTLYPDVLNPIFMKNHQLFCFARQNLNNHPHTSLQNENLKYGIKVGKPKEYGCK